MSEFFNKVLKKNNISADEFYSVLRLSDKEKYIEYTIFQGNGKKRIIEQPINNTLIKIQKALLKDLKEKYYEFIPVCAHAFIDKRSIVTNAKAHLKRNHRYIIKIDIKDFFPSITYQRVYNLIKRVYKFNDPSSAKAYASILTRQGHLPQGAPTSPIISNMICKKLDKYLLKLAKQHNAIYTRYADDITFSLDDENNVNYFIDKNKMPGEPYRVSKAIDTFLSINGFIVNDEKTRLISSNNSQHVCGIALKDDAIKVRRKFILDLRQEIHHLKIKKEKLTQSIIGKLAFLRHINGKGDPISLKYCVLANDLSCPPFPDADFYSNEQLAIEKYVVLIEEIATGDCGSAFFSNGFLITSLHVIDIDKTKDNLSPDKYCNTFKIHFYKIENHKKVKRSILVNIEELYIYEEIALIKFKNINRFANKNLKIQGKIQTPDDQEVMCLGSKGSMTKKSLLLGSNESKILSSSYLYSSHCYILEYNTIYKGMSGGPTIRKSDYKVCGVNYFGLKPGKKYDDYQQNLTSMIDKTIFKYMQKVI